MKRNGAENNRTENWSTGFISIEYQYPIAKGVQNQINNINLLGTPSLLFLNRLIYFPPKACL